jgi:hypothetical protein
MSEYAQRFAENAIDLSVLSDLTDQDLEKLGVLLGHRRKLLRAIANLEGIEKGAPAVPVAPAHLQRREPVPPLWRGRGGQAAPRQPAPTLTGSAS